MRSGRETSSAAGALSGFIDRQRSRCSSVIDDNISSMSSLIRDGIP